MLGESAEDQPLNLRELVRFGVEHAERPLRRRGGGQDERDVRPPHRRQQQDRQRREQSGEDPSQRRVAALARWNSSEIALAEWDPALSFFTHLPEASDALFLESAKACSK